MEPRKVGCPTELLVDGQYLCDWRLARAQDLLKDFQRTDVSNEYLVLVQFAIDRANGIITADRCNMAIALIVPVP